MSRAAGAKAVVARLRLFNRFYTQLVGVLSDGHLGTGLPLGQARVLFELGELGPIDMQGLRRFLGLDPGYLSRLLTSLERARLIRTRPSKGDRRVASRARRISGSPAPGPVSRGAAKKPV